MEKVGLPRSGAVMQALGGHRAEVHPLLEVVGRLARHHQRQWDAEDASRAPEATVEHKRRIDALNAERMGLVSELDAWASAALPSDAPQVHTETLGSVLDRIAIAWVRAGKLLGAGAMAVQAEAQLSELAQAYDQLVVAVLLQERRFPTSRAIKAYRYQGASITKATTCGEQVTISLNGADNIGKTTQLAWLQRGMPGAQLLGTIDGWDLRWREVAGDDFAGWWFERSSTEEHVGLVAASASARQAGAGQLALEDRGVPMLRAVCAATAAIKEGLALGGALKRVQTLWPEFAAAERRRTVHVLLRRSADPLAEARAALAREQEPVGERYAAYQQLLIDALDMQAQDGTYDLVLDVGDLPVLDVQQRLREELQGVGLHVEPLPDRFLERLWVLAGLSESGKSTVGALLRDEYGVARLKIGYLLDAAASRQQVPDPYGHWSEAEQAEQLSEEVLRFADQHQVRAISVESAHREEATRHLKKVWGPRCQVVYLDAPCDVRLRRATEPYEAFLLRERTKLERGASKIADFADHVVDNAGSLGALKLGVPRLALASRDRVVPSIARPQCLTEWLDAAVAHLMDEEVMLVMATGSTGLSHWRSDWSDVDLLVVRRTVPLSWLQDRVGSLPILDGMKTGVSVFSRNDIEGLRVPPRVVHSLRRAAVAGVLYRHEGYRMPVPLLADDDRASRGELGLVLMTLRRLLVEPTIDVRAIYKHVVLVVKILLRADGLEFEAGEEVLTAFRACHAARTFYMPPLDELVDGRNEARIQAQVVGAAGWVLDYVDGLQLRIATPHESATGVWG